MTDLVLEYGGTLDKYIGDAIMAFWGRPFRKKTMHTEPVPVH
jgi:adenylate cyclase